MNLGQLRTSLQAKGYGTDTATSQTEALNAAYRFIAGERQWPWLEAQSTFITTVAGDPDYALSGITDLLHVQAVRITFGTDYPNLEYRDPQEFRDLEHQDRDNGEPIFWTRLGQQIRLWPRPDKIYTLTVDYIKAPPALVADADSPLFDATYHDILVWGAITDMAFRQRDWTARTLADNEYRLRLAAMERAYGVKQRQTTTRVKRSSFWRNVGQGWEVN